MYRNVTDKGLVENEDRRKVKIPLQTNSNILNRLKFLTIFVIGNTEE